METKEFWGRDINEALQAVRAALGADALILETFSVPNDNESEGGERIKVTAMCAQEEAAILTPLPAARGRETTSVQERTARPQPRSSGGVRREELDASGWRELNAQLNDLKTLLVWMMPGMRRSSMLKELVAHDAPPELLIRLLQEIPHEAADERTLLRNALLRLIPTGGDVETKPERRTCLALIGPPGVGKTSAVVKLTVHLLRKSDRKIGWVTLDNRRVTSVEELTVYGGILGIPCESAEGREDLVHAINRLSACDLILIDTPGVNPRDAAALAELAGVLQGQDLPDVRRTLVLNAAANWRALTLWAQQYHQVGFDSVMFSMLDTCECFGPLVQTALTCGRPLSYFTMGARVTQGIETAKPESIVDLLLP
jgi:flagellar biosynthesis protein FlhF